MTEGDPAIQYNPFYCHGDQVNCFFMETMTMLMLILDVKHLVVLILSTLYTLFLFHIVYVKKSAQSTFGNMEKYSVYFYSTFISLYHISLQVALIVHFFYILYILTLVLSFGCFLCLELAHMLKKLTLHSLKMQYAFNCRGRQGQCTLSAGAPKFAESFEENLSYQGCNYPHLHDPGQW